MMNFKLKPTDRTPYTTTELNSPIQIQQWAEKVTSSCLIWLNYEECTRTRFKYLLKFELFQPHALLGVCEGGRQGRKELVFSLQPHHILFAGFKGMLYPEKKAYVIENCWDFSEPEERKPWKPFKWEGLPLSSQLTWNHYSPGHFESSIRKKRHSHQNAQHFQPLSTPPEDQGTRSFGCTPSKPVSFSDKLLHGYISFRAETSIDLK